MTSEKLNQAVQLIKAGNKSAALLILKKIIQTEPDNENAWLWLHSCVEAIEQKKYCLQQAIRINPTNQNARNALLKLENPNPPLVQSTPSNLKSSSLKQIATPKNSPKKKPVSGGILIALIFFSVTLLAGCGLFVLFFKPTLFNLPVILPSTTISLEPTPVPTLSPEKQYAVEMGKILIMIENRKNGAEKDWNLLLAKPIGHKMSIIGVDSSNSTYGALLDSILSSLDYPIVFETYFRDENNLYEFKTLSDASQAVIDSVFDIQVALGGIDVPTSMSIPHREIEGCFESISTYHSLLNKILGGSIPTETDLSNLQEKSCDKFDLSLKKIQQYIDEQSADSGG